MLDNSKPAASDAAQDRPHAPVLAFESVSSAGYLNDVVTVTLANALPRRAEGGQVQIDTVVELYLRTSIRGAKALRDALDKVILATTPAQTDVN